MMQQSHLVNLLMHCVWLFTVTAVAVGLCPAQLSGYYSMSPHVQNPKVWNFFAHCKNTSRFTQKSLKGMKLTLQAFLGKESVSNFLNFKFTYHFLAKESKTQNIPISGKPAYQGPSGANEHGSFPKK
jgi:hypothetical protein